MSGYDGEVGGGEGELLHRGVGEQGGGEGQGRPVAGPTILDYSMYF